LLLRTWSTVAGHSTLALQIPAVAAGVAAPILVYPLARRFGLRPWPALVAGVFLFTSQIVLQMSVRVKPFALDALVTMALLALALRASEAPRNDRRWHALLVVAALALFFSASTLPVIAAAIATVALSGWNERSRHTLVASAFAGAVVLATWYVTVAHAATTDQLHRFWLDNYAPLSEGAGLPRRLGGLVRDFLEQAAPQHAAQVLGPLLGLVALGGGVVFGRRRDWTNVGLLAGPIVVAIGAAILSATPFGGGRTDLYLYPCLAILVGAAFDVDPRAWIAAAAMCFALVAGARTSARDSYPHEDLAGAVAAARADLGDGTRVVVFPEFGYAWSFYGPRGVRLRHDDLSMTGFIPQEPDPNVLLLSGFQASGQGDITSRLRAQAASQVDTIASAPNVNQVLILRSNLFPQDDIPEVDVALRSLGYRQVDGYDHEHGVVERWVTADAPP
jgi:hypothetical protein